MTEVRGLDAAPWYSLTACGLDQTCMLTPTLLAGLLRVCARRITCGNSRREGNMHRIIGLLGTLVYSSSINTCTVELY